MDGKDNAEIPLYTACRYDQLACVKLLLPISDIETKTMVGGTLFYNASQEGHVDVFRLMKEGAVVDIATVREF